VPGGCPDFGDVPVGPGPAALLATLSRQADAARDAKQLERALTLYQRALKLKPDWDEGLWSLGSIAYDLDRYSDCAPAFRRLATLKPGSAPAWTMSGLCEYKLGRYDAALESLSHAESLKFNEPAELGRAGWLHLALVLTKTGNFERAIAVLTDLTRKDKKSPEIIVRAALRHGSAGCRPTYRDSRDLVFKLGDAMAAVMEVDFKAATEKFETVNQQYPQEANVHSDMAHS
jgi:tetratricopeptide (TPR) repeat protein